MLNSRDPGIPFLGNYPRKMKTMFPQNFVNSYSSFIQNCQKLQVIQKPFSWWIKKLWYIHCSGMLLSNKKEQITKTCSNTDESVLNALCKMKDVRFKRPNYLMILFIWHFGEGRTRDRTKISGCLGLVGGIVCKGTLENFLGHGTVLYLYYGGSTRLYASVKTRWTNCTPKSNFFAICKLYRS